MGGIALRVTLITLMITSASAHAQSRFRGGSVYDIPGMGGGPGRAGSEYISPRSPDFSASDPTQPRSYGVFDNRGRRLGTIEERPYGAVLYDNRGRRIETITPRR